MRASLSPKSKKSLAYSIFIIIVLSAFALGYMFYYMPNNKEALHRNGFLILKTISENLQSKNNARIKFYENIFKNEMNIDSIRARLDENKISATVEHYPLPASAESKNKTGRNNAVKINLAIKKDNWSYSVIKEETRDSILFSEPIAQFIEPLLLSQKDEYISVLHFIKSRYSHLSTFVSRSWFKNSV